MKGGMPALDVVENPKSTTVTDNATRTFDINFDLFIMSSLFF